MIASVIAILALIVGVTIPLFRSPRATVIAATPLPAALPANNVCALNVNVDVDGRNARGIVWASSGTVTVLDLCTGEVLQKQDLPEAGRNGKTKLRRVENLGAAKYALLWSNDQASLVEVAREKVTGSAVHGSAYTVRPLPLEGESNRRSLAGKDRRVEDAHTRCSDAGTVTTVGRLSDGTIAVVRRAVTKNLLGEEEVNNYETVLRDDFIPRIQAMTMDREGNVLYAGTDDGRLIRWQFNESAEVDQREVHRAFPDRRAITALALVYGDVSLAVGDAEGELTVWAQVNADETRKLRMLHQLASHKKPIRTILPSGRNKAILSLDDDGVATLDYVTSERRLLSLPDVRSRPLRHVAFESRGDAIMGLDDQGTLTAWHVDSGYPEISFQTLFGKVHYEGYDEPAYAWQTTGGEDYEPKYSVVPLLFGTLKGTIYSMLFAVPLALFGAMYVSYFTTPAFRNLIKPIVEVMATVPSVVIGFLIALWLAPIVALWLSAFLAALATVPAVFIWFMAAWQAVRRYDWAKRVENGYEFLAIFPVLLAGAGLAVCLTSPWPLWHHTWLLAVGLSTVTLPVAFLATSPLLQLVRTFCSAAPMEKEKANRLLAVLPGSLVGIAMAAYAAPHWQQWLFEGDLRNWLFRGPLQMQYDQRNCLIIAFGLGFTVIPIIFSIAEDSLSNVPYSMTAASMAVGASRWQTLWRVILPSASPGIFAAIMIGFGRAVGETMIVLMATGNIPILDWSPLNGMRTLSANIAQEIPGAPFGGTLYRVLFLCAILLFALTFTVNTAAELVRQRLRKRFGRF